jgi:hypothetical protein
MFTSRSATATCAINIVQFDSGVSAANIFPGNLYGLSSSGSATATFPSFELDPDNAVGVANMFYGNL